MSRKFRFLVSLVMALVLAFLLGSSCSSPQPTPTPTPTPSPSPAATVGQYAAAGKVVFASRCAGCHGANGANAPAVIGANAQMSKYGDAQKLQDFVSSAMPKSRPGSLSREEYLQATAFLLLQNNFATENAAFDPNSLANIKLPK